MCTLLETRFTDLVLLLKWFSNVLYLHDKQKIFHGQVASFYFNIQIICRSRKEFGMDSVLLYTVLYLEFLGQVTVYF